MAILHLLSLLGQTCLSFPAEMLIFSNPGNVNHLLWWQTRLRPCFNMHRLSNYLTRNNSGPISLANSLSLSHSQSLLSLNLSPSLSLSLTHTLTQTHSLTHSSSSFANLILSASTLFPSRFGSDSLQDFKVATTVIFFSQTFK